MKIMNRNPWNIVKMKKESKRWTEWKRRRRGEKKKGTPHRDFISFIELNKLIKDMFFVLIYFILWPCLLLYQQHHKHHHHRHHYHHHDRILPSSPQYHAQPVTKTDSTTTLIYLFYMSSWRVVSLFYRI